MENLPPQEDSDEGEEEEEEEEILLELTYPVGRSPKVFTKGWVFGAKCIAGPGTPNQRDLSESVEWSGSGSFSPPRGARSRPTFGGEGSNTIVLTCTVDGRAVQKTFTVNAVSPSIYARMNALARCPADAHGSPCCPHNVVGPVTSGSSLVVIDGLPAVRKGDTGVHAVCCGSNSHTVTGGDPRVLIEGRPAARLGDKTEHCGGMGTIVQR